MKKNPNQKKKPNEGFEPEDKWMVDLFAQKKPIEQNDVDLQAYKNLWLAALQQRMVDLMVFLPRKPGNQSQQTTPYIDWDFINLNGVQPSSQCIDSEQYYYAWQAVRWFEGWQYHMTKSLLDIDNASLDARLKNIITVVKQDLESKRKHFVAKTRRLKVELA